MNNYNFVTLICNRHFYEIFLAASAASGLDMARAKQTLASQQDVLQNPVASFLYIFIIALCFQRY